MPHPPPLAAAYREMLHAHGHQRWWPADSPFEVCVGAILVQNTRWENVELAIARLRHANALHPLALHHASEPTVADWIRPSGCYRVKARRLRAFVEVLVQSFNTRLDALFQGATHEVRNRLLAIPGIGPETADSMLLYAGGHPRFVIDAYTRRIFSRHGWCNPDADYSTLQNLCETDRNHPGTGLIDYWQDFHAQLVRVGKQHCRPREARCGDCPLRVFLPPAPPAPAPAPDPAAGTVTVTGRIPSPGPGTTSPADASRCRTAPRTPRASPAAPR